MTQGWTVDPDATFVRRLGKSASELGNTSQGKTCPDIWELSNGDIAIVGTDMTDVFAARLPADVSVGKYERLVVIPRNMIVAAKPELPDA
jgi:hypothetical protein